MAALTPGTKIGPYEIVSALGAGGMGEVYRGRDTKLERDVAIKVLPEAFAADADRLARFTREAKTLAALNHTNIAHIHGLEEGNGVRALVMEFVAGDDLSQRIARGPIPLDESLAIARQIAEALETAHDQGIVHRDLKPANIKVRPDGAVKVLDFGLAKALSPDEASAASNAANSPTLTAHATQLGVILGTAAYMSPEQAKGKAVDRRADIWAFGVVLYEMLSGQRGYHAEDISETLAAVLTREVDWTALPPETPARLRVLLRDCLARDPKQRLRDIGEARRVLDRLLSGEPESLVAPSPTTPGASAPVPVWRVVLPWATAAVAVAVAAAVAWQSRLRVEPDRPVTRSRVITKDVAGFVALSPDGTKLVYTSAGLGRHELVLRQLDQFEGQPISGSDGAEFPVFSPDGQMVAYSTNTTPPVIKKLPIIGGSPITLANGTFARGGAWGDDTIVFAGAKGLMRLSASGGTAEPLTTLDTAKREQVHARPQFLPGRRLLFTVEATGSDRQVAVLDLEKGGYRYVAKGGDNGRYVPSGHLTFVRDRTLFAAPFDLSQLAVTGTEVPAVENVSDLGPPGTGDYSFSDTGTLAYAEARRVRGTMLSWADRKGTLDAIPGQVPRMWGTGRLSPDGRRVANGIQAEKDTDLWVVDLARGALTRLTFGGFNDNPVWTRDGRRVAYAASGDGKFGVYAVAADGSSRPELIVASEALARPTSFSPDERTLLYTQSTAGGTGRIMVLSLSDKEKRDPRPLREPTSGSDGQGEFSPDGKWVAFTSTETGQREVYVVPFPGPGAKERISTTGGDSPRWAPTGRELFYRAPIAGTATTMSVTITPGASLIVGTPNELFKSPTVTTWDVARDGRFLLETVPLFESGSTLAVVTNWFEELRRKAPPR